MRKEFFLIFLLFLFLSGCSSVEPQNKEITEKSKKQDKAVVEKDNKPAFVKKQSKKSEFHDIFIKIFTEQELSDAETELYTKNSGKAMKMMENFNVKKEGCIKNASKLNSSFSENNIGKNPIVFADDGESGFNGNFSLLESLDLVSVCLNKDSENIEDEAFLNFEIYNILYSKFIINQTLLNLKGDGSVCGVQGLKENVKEYCNNLNIDFVVDSAKDAYAISYFEKDKKISEKDIKNNISDFIEMSNLIMDNL